MYFGNNKIKRLANSQCSVKQSGLAYKQHFNPLLLEFYTRIRQILNISSSNFENNQNTHILVFLSTGHDTRTAHGSPVLVLGSSWLRADSSPGPGPGSSSAVAGLFCSGSLAAVATAVVAHLHNSSSHQLQQQQWLPGPC